MQGLRTKFRTAALVCGLLLSTLLLYSVNLREREKTGLFERSVLRVTAPFLEVIDGTGRALADAWTHYLWLVGTASENERLRAENSLLQGELDALEELRLANERLRELLEFRETAGVEAIPARVVAEDATSWFRTVVIDKGTRDGLAEGMAVVVPAGVVGRVLKVSAGEARVLLITDASSAAAALVQRTRTRGVCRGRGEGLTLEFALRQEDIQVGDRIITSGMGGVFPKGLLIGSVVKVERGDYGLFQAVEITPAADFSRLEEVLVLVREAP